MSGLMESLGDLLMVRDRKWLVWKRAAGEHVWKSEPIYRKLLFSLVVWGIVLLTTLVTTATPTKTPCTTLAIAHCTSYLGKTIPKMNISRRSRDAQSGPQQACPFITCLNSDLLCLQCAIGLINHSCMASASESLVVLRDKSDQLEIAGRLFNDRRKYGSYMGRALNKAVKVNGVDLKMGDRLEPTHELQDVGAFERIDTYPTTVTFWRCKEQYKFFRRSTNNLFLCTSSEGASIKARAHKLN